MVSFHQSPFAFTATAFFASVSVVAFIYSTYCWLKVCFIEEMLWLPGIFPFLETNSMTPEGRRYYRRFHISTLTAIGAFVISFVSVYFGE